MKYRILSPDGLPLCDADPKVNTQAKVIHYIMCWARRYELQEYYLTAKKERIHWLDLPYRMTIIRWGNRGKITEMRVARVGYEQWPEKLVAQISYEQWPTKLEQEREYGKEKGKQNANQNPYSFD